MKLNEVQIGTKLELELLSMDDVKPGHMLISEFEGAADENAAIIAAPINEGVVFPIHTGTEMYVYFLAKRDGSMGFFRFRATVAARETAGNLPLLKIEVEGGIEGLQRRQYYRLVCSVPVLYRPVDTTDPAPNEDSPFKEALASNVSGGGICLRLEEKVETGKLLECEFTTGTGIIIRFFGQVIRYEKSDMEGKYKYEAGIAYIKINEGDREAVVKFIFDEQRRMRKKGLI